MENTGLKQKFINPHKVREPETTELEKALLASDISAAKSVLENSFDDEDRYGYINEVIVPALDRIGKGWEEGVYSLSQVYISGRICEDFILSLKPGKDDLISNVKKTAIAVLEDHHTLGKKTVVAVLHSAGMDVIDYGAGITAEELAKKVEEDKIEIILISALMLRAALKVKDFMAIIREKKPFFKGYCGRCTIQFG